MDEIERRIRRATWLTPASEQERYAEEWRSDIQAAGAAGASADRISRGAVQMALHLRVRQVGQLLFGRLGIVRAVVAWLVLGAVGVLSALFGGIVLLAGLFVTAATVIVLARSGVPTHWSRVLLIASLLLGTVCAAFIWWATGAAIDAADSFTPAPPAVQWTGLAIVVFLLSGAGVLVSGIIAAVTAAKRRTT